MKNIEELKAKSEKGQKKIAEKSGRPTVKDLAMLKNQALQPQDRPYY